MLSLTAELDRVGGGVMTSPAGASSAIGPQDHHTVYVPPLRPAAEVERHQQQNVQPAPTQAIVPVAPPVVQVLHFTECVPIKSAPLELREQNNYIKLKLLLM